MTTESLGRALRYAAAYRPLLDTPELKGMLRLLDKLAAEDGAGAAEEYARIFYLLRQGGFRGLGDWFYSQLRDGSFPYARLVERGETDPELERAAEREIGL